MLPATVLGLLNSALIIRFTRASMLDVLGEDYVRTARAKGLAEARVVLKHALRNALVPIVTVLGLTVALMIGGAVVTETVFGLPGVGNLVVSAVIRRDYPVIQGALLVVAVIYVAHQFPDRPALHRGRSAGEGTEGRCDCPRCRSSCASCSGAASCWARDRAGAGGRWCRLLAGALSGFDPNETAVQPAPARPSAEHLLGTDELGRDLFARIAFGGALLADDRAAHRARLGAGRHAARPGRRASSARSTRR